MRDLILQPGEVGTSARGLYGLCLDAPPVGPRRPPNLRWVLWDCGHYRALAQAYAEGAAGRPLGFAPDTIFAVAWLAGCDASPTFADGAVGADAPDPTRHAGAA